jgi:putative transposase
MSQTANNRLAKDKPRCLQHQLPCALFSCLNWLIRTKPDQTISKIVNMFKGVSARRLFQEFPWIKNRLWGGHLWSPSYFVVTVGGAPLESIKKYVESQRVK